MNPRLPKGFWDTENARRPLGHARWWGRPLVLAVLLGRTLSESILPRLDEVGTLARPA